MKRNLIVLLTILVCGLTACKPGQKKEENMEKETKLKIETSAGDITVKLYNETPKHRDNFIKLVEDGTYEGTLFHRVIKDFMIQAGDPESKKAPKGKMLGAGDVGYTVPAEFVYPKYFHKKGALSAARQGDEVNPDKASSGCQFYIVTGKVYNDSTLLGMEQQMNQMRLNNAFNALAQKHMKEIYKMRKNNDQDGLMDLQDSLIAQAEAQVAKEHNAWTNNDITNYYLTVPKSNVEIGFWLESDRMLELAFSEQSLEVQRAVVMEEFKQRCLNQPYGDVGHLLRPLAYQTHPYRWPTIGKDLSHIANATLDEVKEFFFRFYAPNNAVLAVTGNISWEETVRLTEKWFAPIPRRNVPVRQLPQEVVQTAERRQTVERNVPLDALFMAYHMCSREDADYYAFDILSDILSNGRSSRLTRRLVQEQKLFSSLDAYISGTRDAGLLHISGKPSAGVSLEQAEAAVRKELEELKSGFVGEQELEKVKNKFESTQIFGNINYLNVATNLAWFELTGQAEDIDREVDNYRSVTAEQLHRVAQQTFRDENGIVLYYQKENL